MVKIILILLTLLLTSCSDITEQGYLNLYMNTNQDSNGFYLIDYPDWEDNSYTSVQYETLPYTRVFWMSVDSFTIQHWGVDITEPIINYSTYANDYGNGQQLIYLYQDFIGDTLMVTGCIENDICSTLNFIVY